MSRQSADNSSKFLNDGKQNNNNNVAKTAATKLKSMVSSVHLPTRLSRRKKVSTSLQIPPPAASAAQPSPPPPPSTKPVEEKKKHSTSIPPAPPTVYGSYVNTKQSSAMKSVGTAKAPTLSPTPPTRPSKTKKKQEASSQQQQVSAAKKKKKLYEVSEDDWKFEKFRSEKLDAFEKELKQLEAIQDEMKQLVEKTFNDEDYATLLVQSLLRMVEEVPDILKAKAMGVDDAEESVHKTHVQDIRDISEEIDRIRDQCRDIHSQIKKQKEELHKGDDVTFSRSIYIIIAFIMDFFISIFLNFVWFFEAVSGIKAPQKLHDISKWPKSMLSLQLKNAITIPTGTISTSSNPKQSKRKHF